MTFYVRTNEHANHAKNCRGGSRKIEWVKAYKLLIGIASYLTLITIILMNVIFDK